ncbi:hypothetical protein Tco_0422930 [Tanacetum coccineum]
MLCLLYGGRFPRKVDLWTADRKYLRILCDLPVAKDIPIASNSVRKGMCFSNWRADKPSGLYLSFYLLTLLIRGETKFEVSLMPEILDDKHNCDYSCERNWTPVTNTVANHAEKPEKFNGQNFKRPRMPEILWELIGSKYKTEDAGTKKFYRNLIEFL